MWEHRRTPQVSLQSMRPLDIAIIPTEKWKGRKLFMIVIVYWIASFWSDKITIFWYSHMWVKYFWWGKWMNGLSLCGLDEYSLLDRHCLSWQLIWPFQRNKSLLVIYLWRSNAILRIMAGRKWKKVDLTAWKENSFFWCLSPCLSSYLKFEHLKGGTHDFSLSFPCFWHPCAI